MGSSRLLIGWLACTPWQAWHPYRARPAPGRVPQSAKVNPHLPRVPLSHLQLGRAGPGRARQENNLPAGLGWAELSSDGNVSSASETCFILNLYTENPTATQPQDRGYNYFQEIFKGHFETSPEVRVVVFWIFLEYFSKFPPETIFFFHSWSCGWAAPRCPASRLSICNNWLTTVV